MNAPLRQSAQPAARGSLGQSDRPDARAAELTIRHHFAPNHQGWRLALKQTFHSARLDRRRRPLLIVPGYGMNAFIFGYHPRGLSMEAYLARAGFEVWSANLRRQGESLHLGGPKSYGLKELGLVDVGSAIDYTLAHTETAGATAVDAIGCSLGSTLIYIHAALAAEPRVGAIVAMGGPLRFEMPVVFRALLMSPTLVGAIPVFGTRRLAELVLPRILRLRWLPSVYLHPEITDISQPRLLARAVENPHRHLNRELAHWSRTRDLFIDGRNLTDEFARRVRTPLLSVVANADGIVPRTSALTAHTLGRMPIKEVLEVGTAAVPMAHADLFISDYAQTWVFEPMGAWLRDVRGRAEASHACA